MRFGKWLNLPIRQKVRFILMAVCVLVFFAARLLSSVTEGQSFVGDTVGGVVSFVCMVGFALVLAVEIVRAKEF